jgi:predicted DNA-binding transcriptional regulator YafY
MLKLLHSMAQCTRGVVLKQLADRRGWPLRALYRDIKSLERAGFPVGHEHGRYWLLEGWTPPAATGASQREVMAALRTLDAAAPPEGSELASHQASERRGTPSLAAKKGTS